MGFGNVAAPQDPSGTSPMCLTRTLAGLLSFSWAQKSDRIDLARILGLRVCALAVE